MSEPSKTICIIQARRGSSRLPDKVLKPLGSRPVLAHVIQRARAIPGVETVVVAMPDEPASKPLMTLAKQEGALAYQGSENDVLDRYYQAALYEAEQSSVLADHVMRITSDCPLLSSAVCGDLVSKYIAEKSDYGAVVDFPHGLDCELFKFDLLKKCHHSTENSHDREHVTLWMKRKQGLKTSFYHADKSYHSANRWVVDYPEDYQFLTTLFELMGPSIETAPWDQVVEFVDNHPSLRNINQLQGKLWSEKTEKIIENARK
ncbi:glycosyltransferase family protein [Temperatibacter marinus]|uniref:Glycosyltransferase family protein n=1 Tax=Temperatibacter marinus TaxID=1456591 RepID=A0AA52EB86_9PROT|nr:glycosyltransferase family protein [Temperatibacter marinus]WND01545.1 glycosyltransferase family protein [Temperatibacter marinus]